MNGRKNIQTRGDTDTHIDRQANRQTKRQKDGQRDRQRHMRGCTLTRRNAGTNAGIGTDIACTNAKPLDRFI